MIGKRLDTYTKVPNWLYLTKLTPKARAVYQVLLLHDFKKTGSCWPGLNTIVTMSGFGKTAVNDGINELVQFGLISVEHRHTAHGVRQTNIYRIHQVNESDVTALCSMARRKTAKRGRSEGTYVPIPDIGEGEGCVPIADIGIPIPDIARPRFRT